MSIRLNTQESPERDLQSAASIPVKSRARQLTSLRAVLATTLALVSVAACNRKPADDIPPPPVTPAAAVDLAAVPSEAAVPAEGTNADWAYDPLMLTHIGVDIDSKVAVLCGLDMNKVFFKFDSTKLLAAGKERLEQIATCAKTGPIKGLALRVVGRTDPVGPDAYNQQLGMSRADTVAKFLVDQGVEQALIVVDSKGEAAADENLPGTWPFSRRVSVRLAPPPAAQAPAQ